NGFSAAKAAGMASSRTSAAAQAARTNAGMGDLQFPPGGGLRAGVKRDDGQNMSASWLIGSAPAMRAAAAGGRGDRGTIWPGSRFLATGNLGKTPQCFAGPGTGQAAKGNRGGVFAGLSGSIVASCFDLFVSFLTTSSRLSSHLTYPFLSGRLAAPFP